MHRLIMEGPCSSAPSQHASGFLIMLSPGIPWSPLFFFLVGDRNDPSVVLCVPHCLMGLAAGRIVSSVTPPSHLVIKADPNEAVKLAF